MTYLPDTNAVIAVLKNQPASVRSAFPQIDVEGYEPQVLSGMDLAHYRPWII